MGNIDLVQRVLEKFQRAVPGELEELERLLELRDWEEAARVAHRLKGSAASVSAKEIQRAAAEIEALSRAHSTGDMPVRLDGLRSQWQRYLDRGGSSSAGVC
jgi:HPt (histidine-containing phosphotransfer) domain-containing protein